MLRISPTRRTSRMVAEYHDYVCCWSGETSRLRESCFEISTIDPCALNPPYLFCIPEPLLTDFRPEALHANCSHKGKDPKGVHIALAAHSTLCELAVQNSSNDGSTTRPPLSATATPRYQNHPGAPFQPALLLNRYPVGPTGPSRGKSLESQVQLKPEP